MLYENFVWTPELTQEFNKVILDNYHYIDDIDVATFEFVKSKIKNENGRRIKPIPSSFVREIRNTDGRTVRDYITNS
jgi:hypothetical protein